MDQIHDYFCYERFTEMLQRLHDRDGYKETVCLVCTADLLASQFI